METSLTHTTELRTELPPPLPVATEDKGRFSLPRLLRWGGALMLAIAAIKFVVALMQLGNPLVQYGMFLVFTLGLAGVGAFVTRRWQDAASGRALLGLAAGFVPAHAGALGALLYDSPTGVIGPLGLILLAALPILGFVAWLGLSAVCRSHVKVLLPAYLLGNALLLPTFRDPALIAGLTAFLLVGTIGLIERLRREKPGFVGLEGLLAQVAFFPALLMLPIRQFVWHHSFYEHHTADAWIALFLAASVGYAITGVLARGLKAGLFRGSVELLGLIAWWVAWFDLLEIAGIYDLASLVSFALPVVAWSRTRPHAQGAWLRNLATLGLLIATITGLGLNEFVHEPLGTTTLLLSLAGVAVAASIRERWPLLLAGVASVIGLLANLGDLWSRFLGWHWSLLGVAGLLILVAGSWLEKQDYRRWMRTMREDWR